MMPPFNNQYPMANSWPGSAYQPGVFQQSPMNQFNNQMTQRPVEGIVRVTGRQGAEAYQLPPNSYIPLFDGDSDTLYIKTTDGAGFGSIQEYQLVPKETEPTTKNPGYVTVDEFNALKKELEDVKHNLQSSKPTVSEPIFVSYANPECSPSNPSAQGQQPTSNDATSYGAQPPVQQLRKGKPGQNSRTDSY